VAEQKNRRRSFKISTDPFFIEKVRDIVGLYLNPPDCALVLCRCKEQIQALNRTQPVLPRPAIPISLLRSKVRLHSHLGPRSCFRLSSLV